MSITGTDNSKMKNPFRPGAGHMPPHLAGRESEIAEFHALLRQEVILSNTVLTGLRGVGKTVLLDTFKPMAIREGWLWAGTDLSETTSISEDNLATRLITDLAVLTSSIQMSPSLLSAWQVNSQTTLSFSVLKKLYEEAPGLVSDKLKAVLENVWPYIQSLDRKGIIFAYDEAQNLADHAAKDQFPLSLLLDVFQSLQRKGVCFMLVLTGLPTLFPKLVEARTYSERMFHVIFLEPLTEEKTREAVRRPIEKESCPIKFTDESVATVWQVSRGYPYFIQYICREIFDIWVQAAEAGKQMPSVPVNPIMRKLDSDFFAGRWSRVTDRQRQLLGIVSLLVNSETEFAVIDIVDSFYNRALEKPFGSSHTNQMLASLNENGLIYKNRHGKYSFAVPLLGDFIRRQNTTMETWD